ncbi:MAG: hypothetical protein ACQES2_04145 [Pseudomonadota bacterium]
MSKPWTVRRANESDNDAILEILESTPQMGYIQLAFERRPSYFAALAVSHDEPEVYVYEDREKERIGGLFSCGKRKLFINGRMTTLRYTGDLRIHPEFQGTRALFRMARTLKNLSQPGEWMHTVILSDNAKSLHAVSTGRGGLPNYYKQARFITHSLFLKPRRSAPGQKVRRAQAKDINAMQDLFDREAPNKHFTPAMDFRALNRGDDPHYRGLSLDDFYLLEENDEITAFLGLWDQEPFKQTRVVDYHWSFALTRHLYNLWARVAGGFVIPPKGQTLRYYYACAVTVADNDPARLEALIAKIASKHNGEVLTIGLDRRDPLNRATRRWRKHSLGSEHFVTSYESDPNEQLDDRLTWPEVARL